MIFPSFISKNFFKQKTFSEFFNIEANEEHDMMTERIMVLQEEGECLESNVSGLIKNEISRL